MAEVEVRALRAGDGAGCARAWLDAARYYVGLDPENFQLPAEEGLAAWFEQDQAGQSQPVLRLVATVDGQVAGFVAAVLAAPAPDAQWQLVRAVADARVYVSALTVAETYRRTGVGTRAAQVMQLVRVDDGADGLHDAIGDIQADHVGQQPAGVVEHGTRLPVDLGAAQRDAEIADLPAEAGDKPPDVVAARDRARSSNTSVTLTALRAPIPRAPIPRALLRREPIRPEPIRHEPIRRGPGPAPPSRRRLAGSPAANSPSRRRPRRGRSRRAETGQGWPVNHTSGCGSTAGDGPRWRSCEPAAARAVQPGCDRR